MDVQLHFEVDEEKLHELGIDPETSEGKAKLKEVVMNALELVTDGSIEVMPYQMTTTSRDVAQILIDGPY